MGCKKHLTNDQLEAIFTATHKEMRQIEQPMQCLIERAKNKWKSCAKCFSNKAALKQHQCELQIKKEKYPHCSKTISRANNLEKHLRSCEKATIHPSKQQLHQTTLKGPTALENGPSIPNKLMVEEVKVGGAPADMLNTLNIGRFLFCYVNIFQQFVNFFFYQFVTFCLQFFTFFTFFPFCYFFSLVCNFFHQFVTFFHFFSLVCYFFLTFFHFFTFLHQFVNFFKYFVTFLLFFKIFCYSPGQNIWHKVKKSSKTGQDFKSLLSDVARFLKAIVEV